MQPAEEAQASSPRVAVLGAGYWGRNLVRDFAALGALAAVCDSDPGLLAASHDQYPGVPHVDAVEEVLSRHDIAAVAIATPAATHAALAERAIRAGKDVLVEKPLALSVPDGERLVELAAGLGRILMVGHLLWYHPAVLELKRLVDAGELGAIRYIYSNRLNLGRIRKEENILWSFAPHDLSVILGLVGEMPDTVAATGGTYLHQDVADVTISTLGFPGGVRAHVFVSWLHPFKEQRLVVVGARQMAVFDDTRQGDKLRLYPHTAEWRGGESVLNKAPSRVVPVPVAQPLLSECAHFVDCVAKRIQPRTDGAEGLRVLRVLQRCQTALTDAAEAADRAGAIRA